jgi:hypothetical protein
VKVAQPRPNIFEVTATSQELSALVAAARMTGAHRARRSRQGSDAVYA